VISVACYIACVVVFYSVGMRKPVPYTLSLSCNDGDNVTACCMDCWILNVTIIINCVSEISVH